MKKQYIKPSTTSFSSQCEPLMAGSNPNGFSDTPQYNPNKPAGETDVTSKHHSMWDTTWEDEEEDF